MKGTNLWSYAPYKPLLRDVGGIYVSRIVPYQTKIHFEWLGEANKTYTVFYRKRDEGEFIE